MQNQSECLFDELSSHSSSSQDESCTYVIPDIHDSEYEIQEMIANSSYPIYLGNSKSGGPQRAIKLFPYRKDSINSSYTNECRISNLEHPNIVKLQKTVDHDLITIKNIKLPVSYIFLDLAICDLDKLICNPLFCKDETLVRTIFSQLVDGVEYLHKNGIFHMDLKPENLLLGRDFQLKICDFDLAFKDGDKEIRGKGSYDYRSPELKEGTCKSPLATDLYSLGIILFNMRVGSLPYLESGNVRGYDLFSLMLNEQDSFWSAYKKIVPSTRNLGYDFKELFSGLIRLNPDERLSFDQIRENKWFNGLKYCEEECKEVLNRIIQNN